MAASNVIIPVTTINTPNVTSNFEPIGRGTKWEILALPIVASVAMVPGTLLSVEVSGSSPTGNLKKAAATNANGQNIRGILIDTISTTDSDYATAGKLKNVAVPMTGYAEAFFTVGAGTFTAADVGRVCNIHTDSISLAVDTNGLGAVITGYISATRGTCNFSVPVVVTS